MNTVKPSMLRLTVAGLLLLATVALPAAAEDDAAAKAAAQANNPLANMVAFNVQNYYYAELYGTDETANTAWLRYAQPFGKRLMRASLPISTVPVAADPDRVSGVGDFNVFVEPQFTALHKGVGQPEFQVFAGLNMQFLPKK